MKKLIFILIFIILGASGYWAYSEYLQPKYWYKVASFKNFFWDFSQTPFLSIFEGFKSDKHQSTLETANFVISE